MRRYSNRETEIRIYAVEITIIYEKKYFLVSVKHFNVFYFFHLAYMLRSIGHHQAILTKLRISCFWCK